MNLKNLFAKLSVIVVLLFMFGANAIAQTYVSNTNGNDVTGTGTSSSPYKTISTAITQTATGGTIVIDADTYNESGSAIDLAGSGKNLTYVAQTFNGLSTVTITNGVTIGSAYTVNLGVTGQKFNLGTTATALTLTAGTLNITSANVVIGSGGTITRTAGTISETPTTTNVNVTYNGTASLTAGAELPSSLGTGTLTVGITAGKTLTATSTLTFSTGKIIVNTGNAVFGAVNFTFAATPAANPIYVTNTAGTVTFGGDINFTNNMTATVAAVEILNDDTGTLTFSGSIVNNTSSGTSKITIALTNNTAASGTISLAGGTINGIVTNVAGKTIALAGSTTFSGTSIVNAGIIKLNGNQLTLSGTATLANSGNIISTAASTVGSGLLSVSGSITYTGAGQLPSVSVSGVFAITSAVAATADVTIPVYGSFTLASSTAGALSLGSDATNINTLEIWGTDFTRSDNTVGNVVAGTGVLSFRGGLAQTFTPGASLELYDLLVNKTASIAVTLASSVEVTNNLTITSGTLNVGDYNINLTGVSTFTNGGQAYSSTGVGYVVFEGASGTVTGAGQFGNILVNLSNAANAVTTASDIDFSGILYINKGDFANAATFTLTMNDELVDNPTVKINTTAGNSAALTNASTIVYEVNVNLYYFGSSSYTVAGEWTGFPTKLNDVTIAVDGGLTVTSADASTIYGTLTVNGNTTLNQGWLNYTLAGDSKTHSIIGTVTNGTLVVTGTGSAVNGTTATTTGYNATVYSLAFEPEDNGATFTSSNLKVISDDLTILGTSTATGASATITMNPTTATLTDDLSVGGSGVASTVAVTIAGTDASVFGGDLTLTKGTLTLTRGGASEVITGAVTLTAGTLVLGSDISVNGATSQVAGSIDAGGFTYTQQGGVNYTRSGAGTFTNGTLTLDADDGVITLTPFASSFDVPNLVITGATNTVTIADSMIVSNSLLINDTAPVVMTTGALIVSGDTITITEDATGGFTGAMVLTGEDAAFTLGLNYIIPTLKINSAGTVTLATDDTDYPRTLTVNAAYTNTAGTFATGINNLSITGTGTFTFTAGAITQDTGILTWNTTGTITLPSSGFAIDNLTVAAASSAGTSAFTVNENLVLSSTLSTSAAGKLTLGDGCLVTRTANAATLNYVPTFGTNTDLKYMTFSDGSITTAKEMPSTVRNFTVASSGDADEVILAASVTISGKLTLADMLNAVTNSKTITMADGSTLELQITGTSALDKNLTKAGSMDLIYNGATLTSIRELGAVTSTAYAAYSGDVTVQSDVQLDGGTLVLNGDLTFDDGNFDMNSLALGIGGDVSTTSKGGEFVNTGSAAFLSFVGAENTTLGLAEDWDVPATVKIKLNKTNATNTVTLDGADLDFASNSATLYFVNGVLVTGDNVVILEQAVSSTNQPVQGFDRDGVTDESYVNGNVKKFLDVTSTSTATVALTRVEFPVGDTVNYRPMAFQFTTLPTASVNLTVKEVAETPTGENGFPLTSDDLTITNYPDFYWLVKSDLTLQPAVTYDIEATAAGYTDYQTDSIQNVRFIRRFANNTNNPWIVQGGSGYDNSTDGTSPVVIVRDATGAISTQGAIFTYSQLNKAPVISEPSDVTVNEGETASITWTVDDPDIGQTATVAVVSKPTAATFNSSTNTLSWVTTAADAGTYSVIISATDGVKTAYDTVSVVVVNVNNVPSFDVTGASAPTTGTVKYGSTLTLTYVAVDADGTTPTYSYTVTPTPAGTSAIAAGVLTFTPTYADAGKTFTFTVAAVDASTLGDTVATAVSVTYAYNKGDVNGSGSITSADASPILEYVVGLTTLTEAQLYYADVNGDGVVGAIDAAWVLYAALHDGTFPTAKSIAASGNVDFGTFTSEDGVYSLPISLSQTSGVLSVYTEINLGSNVEYKSTTNRLPEGWIVSSNFENGVLKVAMAGTEALNDGSYAIVNFTLTNKEAVATVEGSAKLNDESSSTMAAKVREIPAEFALSQNYPNPFNPTTSIKYQLANNANVKLVVYNMLGQVVKTLVSQEQEAGYYTIQWNGTNDFGGKVSSGIYIYRIIAGNYISTIKMNLLK